MEYENSLKALRARMLAKTTGMEMPDRPSLEAFVPSRNQQPQETTEDLLGRASGWLSEIKDAAGQFARMYNASQGEEVSPEAKGSAGGFMKGFVEKSRAVREVKEEERIGEAREAFIQRRSEDSPSTYAPQNPQASGSRSTAANATSFIEAIDATEGGGDYDTLFGFSNRAGKLFDGFRVSEMTIGEIKSFSDPKGEYGQWVKGQVGRVATPMGRYQFVGSTLKSLANEMGLPDDTVFSPEVQDAMFNYYLDKRIASGKTMDEKVGQVRQAWEGFKKVPESTLRTLIAQREAI